MIDLVIKDTRLRGEPELMDIGIDDGKISQIDTEITDTAEKTIDTNGGLTSPGFVDCHKHPAKAYAARGGLAPEGYDRPFSHRDIHEYHRRYAAGQSVGDIAANITENIEFAVRNGSTKVRTHIKIGHGEYAEKEMKSLRAFLEAMDETSDIVDHQLVIGLHISPDHKSIVQDEARELLAKALEIGLDHNGITRKNLLLGGHDPATREYEFDRPFEVWFDIADEYDIDVDFHIQDPGQLGKLTLERLVAKTIKNDWQGRVTASHCYCLSHIPQWQVRDLIALLEEAQIKVVTCFQSTQTNMPLKALFEHEIPVGHGTDNDGDFVFPYECSDPVLAAFILANKLQGDKNLAEFYRWYDTNDGMDQLWGMMTDGGAKIWGNEAEYGVEVENTADLVVFDEPSPQWAIHRQATNRYVIKNGVIVAQNGSLVM
jgi:cytosine/adenosine deaminase-related metal-dependent hydrolase